MSNEVQFDLEKSLHLLREAKETLDKSEKLSSDKVASLTKQFDTMSAKFDKVEDENQKLVKELMVEKEKQKEAQDKLNLLEKSILRFGSGNPEYKEKSMGIKALENFMAFGKMNEVVTKDYLRTDNNVDGGFLMKPVDFDNVILKPITEISPVRSVARKRQVNALKAAEIVRDILVSTYWTKEGAARTASISKYGLVNIMVHSQTAFVQYTQEAVLDSMFSLENEIQSDIAEQFAKQEGAAFVNGDGVKEPQGFMTVQANLPRFNSGIANDFDFDAMLRLTGELKAGYNPIYAMHRKTVAHLRTLKASTSGLYYWGVPINGRPSTIAGYPYLEFDDMTPWDGVTANAENVIFADFARMYQIIDSYQAIVIRDPFTYSNIGQLAILMHRFVGGSVVMPEAGVVLKNAT